VAQSPAIGLISPLVGRTPRSGKRGPEKRKAFKLFDPLKSFEPEAIWYVKPSWESQFGQFDPAVPCTSTTESPLDATHLGQRLNALMRALDDLPRQGRLVRWQVKRDAALKASKPTRLSPIRPGLPPGWRMRKVHEIDDVLKECHGLANDLFNAPNTS
jgi:hypothetical protein